MVSAKELKTKYNVSNEELEELGESAKAYESGEWPDGKTVRIGRPPYYDGDELQNVTVRIRRSRLNMVDSAAKMAGESRSDFFRDAVDEKLARFAKG
jgi:hypothetical protein